MWRGKGSGKGLAYRGYDGVGTLQVLSWRFVVPIEYWEVMNVGVEVY